MPDQLAVMKERLKERAVSLRDHDVSWLEGVMYCAEYAHSIAESDDQRLLAERLLQNALDGQAEAYVDAAMADE